MKMNNDEIIELLTKLAIEEELIFASKNPIELVELLVIQKINYN